MSDLHIPAAPAFMRGYCGPADEFVGPGDRWARTVLFDGGPVIPRPGERRYRLHASRPEVRDHVARVVSAGVRCSGCPSCKPVVAIGESDTVRYLLDQGACADCGGRVRTIEEARQHEAGIACEEENEANPDRAITIVYVCNGSGYLLRPAPIEHLLDRPGSRLTADQSAVLVAWSARSWLRGGEVIAAVLDVWRHWELYGARTVVVGPDRWRAEVWEHGWNVCGVASPTFYGGERHGPETGPEGRACADRAMLAAHIAYINEGSVVTPEEPNV